MAVFPGRRLRDWEGYWHGAFEYQDQKDFDHLFDALRKAGMTMHSIDIGQPINPDCAGWRNPEVPPSSGRAHR